MKRTIGIDARLYRETGVGVYIRNLIHYLSELKPSDIHFYLYLPPNGVNRFSLNSNFTIRFSPYRWHSFSEQTLFLRQLLSDRLDVMHFTYFGYPILYHRPFIATVHDTIMLDYKTGRASTRSRIHYELKHAVYRLVFATQISQARKIIVPTQSVADKLTKKNERLRPKIAVISEGVNYELLNTQEDNRLSARLQGRFFLRVGNYYPHKNVEALIAGYLDSAVSEQLVLVGPDDHFLKGMRKLVSDRNASDRVVFITDASGGDLVYLYKHASALLVPSFDEGFCLPLAEATHFQLPVIASDIPVFRELMGSSYTAFDPNSAQSIAEAIRDFSLSSVGTREAASIGNRSFSQMAHETLDLYRHV